LTREQMFYILLWPPFAARLPRPVPHDSLDPIRGRAFSLHGR